MFLASEGISAIKALEILLPVALILLLSKLLQMGCKKIKLPQVVGMLLAGLLIGFLNFLGEDNALREMFLNDTAVAGIKFLAEIGVVLIMFQAGLGTNLGQIKKCGVAAMVVTALGVIVPMGLGFVVAGCFNGFSGSFDFCRACGNTISDQAAHLLANPDHVVITVDKVWSNLFYGVILTATSVSVTVATLNELGKLHGKAGTIIVSAAILDDIIGVVVLSVILSLSGTNPVAAGQSYDFGEFLKGSISIGTLITQGNESLGILAVLLDVVLFFIFVIAIDIAMHHIFKLLNKRKSHTRRVPIFGIAFAFFMAWAAESWFGIADITGAFFAGLALAGIGHHINHPATEELKDDTSDYIGRKSDVLLYMLFSPLFFAKVGITTNFSGLEVGMIGFGVCFILAGLAGKVLGCGLGAKMTKHSWVDSLRIGIGMMARAEVALICATKGMEAGLVDSGMSAFIVVMIIVSSFVTPLVLKATYKNEKKKEDYEEEVFTATNDHAIADASPLSGNYNGDDVEP